MPSPAPPPAWTELPAPPSPDPRPVRGRVAVVGWAAALAGCGVVARQAGDPRRALLMLAVAGLLALLGLAVPALAQLVLRLTLGLGRAVRTLCWLAVALVVDLAVALPGRALGRLSRHDLLTGRRRGAATAWRTRRLPDDRPAHCFSRDLPAVGEPVPAGMWPRPHAMTVAGVVAVIVVADLLLGSVWTRLNPPDLVASTLITEIPPSHGVQSGLLPGPFPDDPRSRTPALADAPWAPELYREQQAATVSDDPFLVFHNMDSHQRYINIVGGNRVSYAPTGAARRPEVWLFGGSTVWGEGQRDTGTIASDLARRSEADGHPIRVVNFGVRGMVKFQEVLQLEQALASRPRPALIVVYDGANDLAVATQVPPSPQPMIFDVSGIGPSAPLPPQSLSDLWASASFLRGLGRSTAKAERHTPQGDAANAAEIYQRATDLTTWFAASAGVPVVQFLQPAKFFDSDVAREFRAQLPKQVIDISQVLDGPGQATYIDGVHTNEQGAQVVADALYAHLKVRIAQLPPAG